MYRDLQNRPRGTRNTKIDYLLYTFSDDQPDVGLSSANFAASSNSSLSSGGASDSPSTSMEQMGGIGANTSTTGTTSIHQQPQHHHQHSHQDSFHSSIGGSSNASFWGGSAANGQMARHWNYESDDEDDVNEADWSSNVAAEVLAALTDAEKKRQEIINGKNAGLVIGCSQIKFILFLRNISDRAQPCTHPEAFGTSIFLSIAR